MGSLPERSAGRQRFTTAQRTFTNHLVTGLAILSTVLVLVPLVAILVYLFYKGARSLSLNFFTHLPTYAGQKGGGMANAIVGSGIVLGMASLMGIPLGIGGGIYLAEYGRGGIFANVLRFTADVLNGVPSIVMGLVAAVLIVERLHMGHSSFAGAVALAIMMVPTVTRTTEEMLATVPHAIREAALGLGIPRWRMIFSISLRTASPGIITGCMLAFARVAGETAPLLFTAFGNTFWTFSNLHSTPIRKLPQVLFDDVFHQPIAALPLPIYQYATSADDEQKRLAWAGALVLIALIMVSVTLVRIFANRGALKGGH
jgi:phosphate transport system permease protein